VGEVVEKDKDGVVLVFPGSRKQIWFHPSEVMILEEKKA